MRFRILLLCCAVVGAVAACGGSSARPASSCAPTDPLRTRALADLADFTGWLERYRVPGYVGEVGWPGNRDAAQWNRLAESWYGAADAAKLWVTAWAAAEQWPASYPLAVFRGTPDRSALHVAGSQAPVIAAHPSTSAYLRGVDLADGSFGGNNAGYANTDPGRYGIDYRYESARSYRYLAASGVRLVRLSFLWERLQPSPGSPLNPQAVARLRQAVAAAHSAGLQVILDLHNYGRYRIARRGRPVTLALGSRELPTSDLADFWRRMSAGFRSVAGVAGYDLMNEPHDLPGRGPRGGAATWEVASQQAVSALRRAGDSTTVLVEGYGYAQAGTWSANHPGPWITDPAKATRYEAHQYFDTDRSGTYADSFAAEQRTARRSAEAGCHGRH